MMIEIVMIAIVIERHGDVDPTSLIETLRRGNDAAQSCWEAPPERPAG